MNEKDKVVLHIDKDNDKGMACCVFFTIVKLLINYQHCGMLLIMVKCLLTFNWYSYDSSLIWINILLGSCWIGIGLLE